MASGARLRPAQRRGWPTFNPQAAPTEAELAALLAARRAYNRHYTAIQTMLQTNDDSEHDLSYVKIVNFETALAPRLVGITLRPGLTPPPQRPARCLLGPRPLLRAPKRRLRSLEACVGPGGPPPAAPRTRSCRLPPTGLAVHNRSRSLWERCADRRPTLEEALAARPRPSRQADRPRQWRRWRLPTERSALHPGAPPRAATRLSAPPLSPLRAASSRRFAPPLAGPRLSAATACGPSPFSLHAGVPGGAVVRGRDAGRRRGVRRRGALRQVRGPAARAPLRRGRPAAVQLAASAACPV